MIYGLYLSASGVITSSYRQDVIANNLANSETVGFKKDVALFRPAPHRGAAAPPRPAGSPLDGPTNPLLEPLGGGIFAHPTVVDTGPGRARADRLRRSTSPSRATATSPSTTRGETRLTRNGQFAVD